jgi:hypothetical protein
MLLLSLYLLLPMGGLLYVLQKLFQIPAPYFRTFPYWLILNF